MKRYVAVRVPKLAYDNLILKKQRMESVVKQLTRKEVNIPLTKVLIAITENPITLDNTYLIKNLAGRKKIKCRKIK